MNMDELYEEMKGILDYFELSFHAKDQIAVLCTDGFISFTYRNKRVTISIKE